MVCFQLILLQKYGLFFICANVMVQLFLFFHKNDSAKNGADCYSKNGDAVTVLTWQS